MPGIAGFERTKRDVIRVVHIGATTLAKRVTEFAGTSASAYTFDDFEVHGEGLAGARFCAAPLVSAALRRLFESCKRFRSMTRGVAGAPEQSWWQTGLRVVHRIALRCSCSRR